MKRSLVAALLMSVMCSTAFAAAEGGDDAGAQMRRAQEALERQRVIDQINEDEQSRRAEVEQEETPEQTDQSSVTFTLKRVEFSPTEILSEDELNGIVSEYLERDISLNDINAMIEKINALYAEKGYMTCRAYLPPQRIHEGVVQIGLLEGRTGNVNVINNKHTLDSYIKNSFPLTKGALDNTVRVNEHLQWFNGVNDVQLRMAMKAGSEFGTTDYDIYAFEPTNQRLSIMVDNNGYDSSGRWREYVFYNNRSLTNQRDAFRLYWQHSKGTEAWGTGYTLPLGHRGIKLDFDYSNNNTENIKGQMKSFGVESDSYSAGVTLRVPFKVDRNSRYEAGFQYQHNRFAPPLGRR